MAARKKTYANRALLAFVLLAFAVSISLNIYSFYFYRQQTPYITPFLTGNASGNISEVGGLSAVGFSKVTNVSVQQLSDHYDIYIDSGCKRLIGSVNPVQGQSIANALDNVIDTRPNTHDLMKDVFDVLGVKVLMVKVAGIKGNNYLGQLVIQQGSRIASLDSRPSDGVAIALRVSAPIYVNTTMLNDKGENIC